MAGAGFLLITVVTGVLLAVTGIAIARSRRGESYVPALRPSGDTPGRPAGIGVGSAVATLGVVALLVVVADPLTIALLAGPALVVAFLTWGIYSLARSRGLPMAHSVGLSTWVVGVVLIGAIAVQLLIA